MNGSLKLLLIGINYAPWSTGIPKYTAELAAWLVERGHSVEAISGMPHYPAWKIDPAYAGEGFLTEEINGVRVHRTPLWLRPKEHIGAKERILMETSFTLLSLRYLVPILFRSERYDVAIAICPTTQTALLPRLYSLSRSVPWLLHVQDLQIDAAVQLGMVRGGVFRRLLLQVERALLRSATAVSTISEAMRRKIIAKGVPADNVFLCPNWADLDAVRPGERMNSFRGKIEAGEENMVLLCSGSMGEKHGLQLILEAADRLRHEASYRFVLVGDGSARAGLEQIARDRKLSNVRFMPLQPPEALPEMMAAADVHLVTQKRGAADLVMPSRLTNIFASGRPVIATTDPGTALFELIGKADAGLTCPSEEIDPFVAAIRIMGKNDDLRARMGRHAREHAEAHFGRDQVMPEFERVLLRLRKQR
jgi:colanic acid biosynthesis glycosyl transferase WcaI